VATPTGTLERWAKLALTFGLTFYGLKLLRNPGDYGFLDSVDLAIHETGHLVFSPFGMFIGFAGGTLFQLIVPITFVVYFLKQKDRFAASIVLWWVAQNLWNISVYIKDARAQILPLVGGGEHDWTFLLGRTGLLARDQNLGDMVHFFGVLLFCLSILLSMRYAWIGKTAPPLSTVSIELKEMGDSAERDVL
jgi:hypothetical protein